ncbi:MBL fold metallo-hydrolase [Antribacter gilvus]|uniref:MBL fold metallo-hydrolase n=1 Tax=Antribacter gilvus TaxID=2304675 RepID=UPI000F7AC069|nr:MBL fold metallo-hydrolase [Antribacter gilvus]
MTRTVSRRTLLTGAAALGAISVAAPARAASPAPAAPLARTVPSGFATFSWLGTSGWKIRTPTTTVLLDPYLSRFDTGFGAGAFTATTRLAVDQAAIDAAIGTAGAPEGTVDAVLVTHTHWDHFADVPAIAAARGPMVFTTLTGYHLALAMGVPRAQLAVVRGGEELHLGDLVMRVVPSLHSRTGTGALLFPGAHTQTPRRPRTIADLPEGDTLSFLLRSPEGRSVLLLGGSDLDDLALRGLDVDTVALPVASTDATAGYVERVMTVLQPSTVVLVHWDSFEVPLANPPQADDRTRARMAATEAEVLRHSPGTRVVVPEYLTPLTLL